MRQMNNGQKKVRAYKPHLSESDALAAIQEFDRIASDVKTLLATSS